MWKKLRQHIGDEDPTPLPNEVHLGCTQCAAESDGQMVKAKKEVFGRITPNLGKRNAKRHNQFSNLTRPLPEVTTWKELLKHVSSHKVCEAADTDGDALH